MEKNISLVALNKELNSQLAEPSIIKALLATTFKGLSEQSMRQAALEGMLRGFKFQDFLKKNVYAIPYGGGYSLVTSIDYARKIGMKSGVVGKSAPIFEMEDSNIVSCTITIKRKVSGSIGEFTDTVYFDEYTTGKNLWVSKPRTMIAKVAEMHALRMACPEEMSQIYTQEEFDKEADTEEYDQTPVEDHVTVISTGDDTPGLTELVVPKSDTERKSLIIKELKRIDPTTDVSDAKELKRMVADLTELEFTPKNYANIIHLLARK